MFKISGTMLVIESINKNNRDVHINFDLNIETFKDNFCFLQ